MSTASTTIDARAATTSRWGYLAICVICMVMIANLQYGWTLFVNPIDQKYHWGRAAIQVAFTIFVLTETWLVPIEGYLIDKFGPRIMISGSGVLVAIAWVINSLADSLLLLYLGAAIGGIGAGVIYGGSVGNALKWFPDRRGLAAGLTAAGFGAGSALTVIPNGGVGWPRYNLFSGNTVTAVPADVRMQSLIRIDAPADYTLFFGHSFSNQTGRTVGNQIQAATVATTTVSSSSIASRSAALSAEAMVTVTATPQRRAARDRVPPAATEDAAACP